VSVPATPYVSAAAFRAHPTYLDTDGLIPGNSDPDAQTAQLTNLLLQASSWADNECNQPLGAHLYTQSTRARTDRNGMLRIHADHGPVSTVTALSYGFSPTSLTAVASPSVWVEDGSNLVITLGGSSTAWSGSLQVGFGAGPGAETFVRVTVVAAYVATQLSTASTAGATSIAVADPTGIEPGGSYRIWEPGREETITVSPLWLAPTPSTTPAPATVLLAAPTLFDHAMGHDVSGLPSEIRLAIVLYTISLLMRPDTTAEDEFPDTSMNSTTRGNDSRKTGQGLVGEARRILASYGRVR
jgi:hypothetical protein